MTVLPDLAAFPRFALDTETTGIDYHSRPVGLSIATPDGASHYLSWGHQSGNNTTLQEVREWARRELTRTNQLHIFHHALFDLRQLAYADIPICTDPGALGDTMTIEPLLNELTPSFSLNNLARTHLNDEKDERDLEDWITRNTGNRGPWKAKIWMAPGDVVAPYAMHDAAITLRLHDLRRPLLAVPDPDGFDLEALYRTEIALLPLLTRMHLTGVRVNVPAAEAAKAELERRLKAAQQEWMGLAGNVDVHSTQQLAALFRARGLTVPETEKGNPSLTGDYLETLDHPLAKLIVQQRSLHHFAGTFIDSYILKNADEDGLIHGEFHPLRNDRYGTVSGRFSSGGGLNLQNFPARDKAIAGLIRGLFIPYLSGQRWAKIDYSNIEYRFLAHYAGGPVAEAYRQNPYVDFHRMMAELCGISRDSAKTTNFCIVYGGGIKEAAQTAGIPEAVMRGIFGTYHERTGHVIKALTDKVVWRASTRGVIRTWGGRRRRFRPKGGGGFEATYAALNALLQGSAADLIKRAMVRVAPLIDWTNNHLHLTVHDELDPSVDPGAIGDRFLKDVKDAMEDFPLSVPIRADVAVGPDWGHTTGWNGPAELAKAA